MKKNIVFALSLLAIAASCAVDESYNMDFAGEYYPSEEEGAYEPADGDRFDEIRENPFVKTSENDKSTFSVPLYR